MRGYQGRADEPSHHLPFRLGGKGMRCGLGGVDSFTLVPPTTGAWRTGMWASRRLAWSAVLWAKRGTTQEQLAWAPGFSSKGYLSRIKNGFRLSSLAALAQVAEALEVEVRDLLIFPERSALDAAWSSSVRRGRWKRARCGRHSGAGEAGGRAYRRYVPSVRVAPRERPRPFGHLNTRAYSELRMDRCSAFVETSGPTGDGE